MQDTLQEMEVRLVPVSSVVSLGIGQMHVPTSSGDVADKLSSGKIRCLLTFLWSAPCTMQIGTGAAVLIQSKSH